METFSALLALCAGNSPVIGEFPAPRPVTQSFDVFFGDASDLKRHRTHYDVIVMQNAILIDFSPLFTAFDRCNRIIITDQFLNDYTTTFFKIHFLISHG